MPNSINTNISAYFAQANISSAANAASASVSRLSSGNRIVKASDDVAALSTGTSLRTQVTALKTALTNASQGTSLLQVADGALGQVTEILQRQKAIALQAGSGSLTDTDRGYLDQEFQALTKEIDRLSGATNFNGVTLLNGALSTASTVTGNTTAASKASLQVNVTGLTTGQTLILNGVTLTFKDTPTTAGDIQRGTTIAQSLDNAVTYLNSVNDNNGVFALSAANKAKVTGASYSRAGDSLIITSRAGGNLSEFYRVDALAANNGTSTVTVNGFGGQVLAKFTGFTATNIDTSVAESAPTATQLDSDATITFDALAVATLAAGDTLRTIRDKVNALTVSTGVSSYITGTSGAYELNFISSDIAATGAILNTGKGASVTIVAGAASTVTSASGGSTTGLGQGAVIGYGDTGGTTSILTDQNQQKASTVYSFPDISAGDLTSASNFGTARDITIEGQVFTFTTNSRATKAGSEITIGATLQETLDNAVEAINSFSGTAPVNYALRQIEASRSGNSIVITNRQTGDALDSAAGTLTVASTAALITGASISSGTLTTTNNTGIDTKGVTNAAFAGKIQGFSASYVSSNTVNLSVTVGGKAYSALNVATNPTANTDVRLISTDGGYFDVKLRANQGLAVNNSANAATFAQKIDAAFAGVTFVQKRDLTSYNPTGSLIGSSVKFQGSDFSNLKLSDITVTAPSGSSTNGSINFTINGENYSSQSTLGTQLGANSITRFVSASDSNKFLEFRNGATPLGFATSTAATTLANSLKTAFGVKDGASSLSFQIGSSSADTLSVSIGNSTSASLFNGQSLNVLSTASASAASDQLDKAISTVTTLRASVGALQSRFNFAAANIQIAVQNQDAARSALLDTDVAAESTSYATSQVKIQAGISVLAQANQQLQNLLKLIQ